MSLEGRAPWDQAESESVVDQCEAAGGQVEALPIGARDRLALPCRMIRQASVRSDARCRSLKLASPQRVEEITCEYDALALPVGEALPDQALDASVYRLADFAAESTRAKRGRFTSDELAVEPGGAARPDLRLDRQVGTHRQRDALAADGILESAELDDAARRGVARRVQVGQANMISTSVDPVDNGVGCALELVIEAAPGGGGLSASAQPARRAGASRLGAFWSPHDRPRAPSLDGLRHGAELLAPDFFALLPRCPQTRRGSRRRHVQREFLTSV